MALDGFHRSSQPCPNCSKNGACREVNCGSRGGFCFQRVNRWTERARRGRERKGELYISFPCLWKKPTLNSEVAREAAAKAKTAKATENFILREEINRSERKMGEGGGLAVVVLVWDAELVGSLVPISTFDNLLSRKRIRWRVLWAGRWLKFR